MRQVRISEDMGLADFARVEQQILSNLRAKDDVSGLGARKGGLLKKFRKFSPLAPLKKLHKKLSPMSLLKKKKKRRGEPAYGVTTPSTTTWTVTGSDAEGQPFSESYPDQATATAAANDAIAGGATGVQVIPPSAPSAAAAPGVPGAPGYPTAPGAPLPPEAYPPGVAPAPGAPYGAPEAGAPEGEEGEEGEEEEEAPEGEPAPEGAPAAPEEGAAPAPEAPKPPEGALPAHAPPSAALLQTGDETPWLKWVLIGGGVIAVGLLVYFFVIKKKK